MGPEFVRDVMVGGWWVMRKGHVVTCDEAGDSRSRRSKSPADCTNAWQQFVRMTK